MAIRSLVGQSLAEPNIRKGIAFKISRGSFHRRCECSGPRGELHRKWKFKAVVLTTVLLTGASGMLGHYVLDSLQEAEMGLFALHVLSRKTCQPTLFGIVLILDRCGLQARAASRGCNRDLAC